MLLTVADRHIRRLPVKLCDKSSHLLRCYTVNSGSISLPFLRKNNIVVALCVVLCVMLSLSVVCYFV
jgi:hypothetical protein